MSPPRPYCRHRWSENWTGYKTSSNRENRADIPDAALLLLRGRPVVEEELVTDTLNRRMWLYSGLDASSVGLELKTPSK